MPAVLAANAPPVDVTSAEAAAAGLRTFFRIAEQWALSPNEQITLLGVSRATFYQWRQGKIAALDRHVLERLSYLFGIYKALQILFPTPERAARWVRAANKAPLFNGQSALDRMLSGLVSDLYVVRQYLDAQRGGKS